MSGIDNTGQTWARGRVREYWEWILVIFSFLGRFLRLGLYCGHVSGLCKTYFFIISLPLPFRRGIRMPLPPKLYETLTNETGRITTKGKRTNNEKSPEAYWLTTPPRPFGQFHTGFS